MDQIPQNSNFVRPFLTQVSYTRAPPSLNPLGFLSFIVILTCVVVFCRVWCLYKITPPRWLKNVGLLYFLRRRYLPPIFVFLLSVIVNVQFYCLLCPVCKIVYNHWKFQNNCNISFHEIWIIVCNKKSIPIENTIRWFIEVWLWRALVKPSTVPESNNC